MRSYDPGKYDRFQNLIHFVHSNGFSATYLHKMPYTKTVIDPPHPYYWYYGVSSERVLLDIMRFFYE